MAMMGGVFLLLVGPPKSDLQQHRLFSLLFDFPIPLLFDFPKCAFLVDI